MHVPAASALGGATVCGGSLLLPPSLLTHPIPQPQSTHQHWCNTGWSCSPAPISQGTADLAAAPLPALHSPACTNSWWKQIPTSGPHLPSGDSDTGDEPAQQGQWLLLLTKQGMHMPQVQAADSPGCGLLDLTSTVCPRGLSQGRAAIWTGGHGGAWSPSCNTGVRACPSQWCPKPQPCCTDKSGGGSIRGLWGTHPSGVGSSHTRAAQVQA